MKLFIMFYSYVTYLTCAKKFVSYLTEDVTRVHCEDEQANDVSYYCETHREPTNLQCGKTRSALILRNVAYVATSGP